MTRPPFKFIGEDTIYCYKDYNAYHITETKNMNSIKIQGLKRKNGERCQKINDDIKGIFFTDNIYGVGKWIEWLYPDTDITSLILLRFNLLHRKFHYKSFFSDEYYSLVPKIKPEKLWYLEIKKEEKKMFLNSLLKALYYEREYRLDWYQIQSYKLENTDK